MFQGGTGRDLLDGGNVGGTVDRTIAGFADFSLNATLGTATLAEGGITDLDSTALGMTAASELCWLPKRYLTIKA